MEFKEIEDLYNLLTKKKEITDVLNFKNDDPKELEMILKEPGILSSLKNKFIENINYLKKYAFKNDDYGNDEINLNEIILDFDVKRFMQINVNIFDQKKQIILFKTTICLLILCVTAVVTKDIKHLLKKEDTGISLQLNEKICDNKFFFRGHQDEKFKLLPSLLRNYSCSDYGKVINKGVLEKIYKDNGMLDRYNEIFGSNKLDYNFLSFAQHSASYSPFLDLTRNHVIALSFATQDTINPFEYLKNSACVYSFVFKKEEIIDVKNDFDLSEVSIKITPNKLKFSSIINGKYIFDNTPKDFEPIVKVFTGETNDRMKYQKGSFLFFERCHVVNGHILLPYHAAKIVKYVIRPQGDHSKKNILKVINSDYRKYDLEHLMNPYQYEKEN